MFKVGKGSIFIGTAFKYNYAFMIQRINMLGAYYHCNFFMYKYISGSMFVKPAIIIYLCQSHLLLTTSSTASVQLFLLCNRTQLKDGTATVDLVGLRAIFCMITKIRDFIYDYANLRPHILQIRFSTQSLTFLDKSNRTKHSTTCTHSFILHV